MLQAMALVLLLSYLFTARKLVQSSLQAEKEEENQSKEILKNFSVEGQPHPNATAVAVRLVDSAIPTLPSAKHSSKSEHVIKAKPPSPFPKKFIPKIFQRGHWDVAPIVVEEYKLLFFTQGKVACTEFKKILRRMMGLKDWRVHKEPNIPHNPQYNGLKYLYHYPLPTAMHMLTDPNWTRAIFVRDPKERLLSAYLDKAAKKKGAYVDRHCCSSELDKPNSCGKTASRSLLDFVKVIRERCCCDPHWKPQSLRIDEELWDYVNFVGNFDSLATDTRRMLEHVGLGAWKKFGASGWGKFRNESIFVESSTSKHRTSARAKMLQYFNDTITEGMVDGFYADDYKQFHFPRYHLVEP